MNQVDHEYYQERLSAFVDNELPPAERAQLEEHLAECPDCRKRVDELRQLEDLVSRQSALEDTAYWEKAAQRIEAALPERAAITDLGRERARRSAWWWRLPAVAASVLILGYIGLHESDILKKVPIQTPQPALSPEIAPVEKAAAPPVDTSTQTERRPGANAKDETGAVAVPSATQPSREAAVQKPVATPVDTSIQPEELQGGRSDEDKGQAAAPVRKIKGARVDTVRQTETVSSPAPASVDLTKTITVPPERSPVPAADSIRPKVDQKVAAENYKTRLRVGTAAVDTGTVVDHLPSPDMGVSILNQSTVPDTTGLASWRKERDSLVAVVSGLKGASSSTGLLQKFSAAPPAPTTGTDALTKLGEEQDRAIRLETAESDLIEAWFQVCRRSADTAEVRAGIDFLKTQAKGGTGVNQLRAEQYLKQLDVQ